MEDDHYSTFVNFFAPPTVWWTVKRNKSSFVFIHWYINKDLLAEAKKELCWKSLCPSQPGGGHNQMEWGDNLGRSLIFIPFGFLVANSTRINRMPVSTAESISSSYRVKPWCLYNLIFISNSENLDYVPTAISPVPYLFNCILSIIWWNSVLKSILFTAHWIHWLSDSW